MGFGCELFDAAIHLVENNAEHLPRQWNALDDKIEKEGSSAYLYYSCWLTQAVYLSQKRKNLKLKESSSPW